MMSSLLMKRLFSSGRSRACPARPVQQLLQRRKPTATVRGSVRVRVQWLHNVLCSVRCWLHTASEMVLNAYFKGVGWNLVTWVATRIRE